ncbi:MAG: DUF2283 domain-containing protein [Myxococcales bacterium]|nr:DUF2283 domain-containing protein [Myxococcales bacterium]
MELSGAQIQETKELNENVYVDLDINGKVVGLTIEHAQRQTNNHKFSYEVAA